MRTTSAYARLLKLGTPVIRTADAAAALKISVEHASQLLRRLDREGFVQSIKRGYWAFSPVKEPLLLTEYLTAPYPAYVSLQSALYLHGLISQVPAVHYVVSLTRTRTIATPSATFSVHHIGAEFFFGYEVRNATIKVATPEKALLDFFYLQQNHPKLFKRLPELDLSENFDPGKCLEMISAIGAPQRRKHVEYKLNEVLLREPGVGKDSRGLVKKKKSRNRNGLRRTAGGNINPHAA